MMMQHNKFDGAPIGISGSEKLDERMRRIRIGMLDYAKVRAGADSPWFAVRVMSGREKAVKNSLDDAGIEALVPMRKGPEYRRRGRVLPATLIPVMTGYVLVRFIASEEAFISLRGVEHVIDTLGGCLNPHRISNNEVKRFKALADEGELDWEKPTTVFAQGEKVRISEGPFGSFFGEIITCRSDGKGDAVVEVEIFGRMTPVLIPLAILEKV